VIVICINIDNRYKHHRKLKVGQKYLQRDTGLDSTWYIKELGGTSLGFFSRDLFITIDESRNNKINEILN
jgi:hypothetical protein